MGSILKVTADGFDTSPILRGHGFQRILSVIRYLLLQRILKWLNLSMEKKQLPCVNKLRNIKNPACYACHKSIDPYGFALESFDATGQWRKQYRVKNLTRIPSCITVPGTMTWLAKSIQLEKSEGINLTMSMGSRRSY